MQNVESIFKKPRRAAGKLTLNERTFEEEGTSEKREVFDEENQKKVTESLEVSKVEKKRVRLTIGVKPEDDWTRKKRGPKVEPESRDDMDVDQQVARLRQNVVRTEEKKRSSTGTQVRSWRSICRWRYHHGGTHKKVGSGMTWCRRQRRGRSLLYTWPV